jgi:type III restriction enzyme
MISQPFEFTRPQRRSLELLDRITELFDLPGAISNKADIDVGAVLDAIRAEFPQVQDFERDFPSLCFALATGVGKTRLMGAFIPICTGFMESQTFLSLLRT